MSEVRYTQDHLWVRRESDGLLTVGISTFAREHLGDVVFVELPEIGARAAAGGEIAVIESAKVAVDLRMPVSGTIAAINESVANDPDIVNSDPSQSGWLFRIQPDAQDEFDQLIDFLAYDKLISR